MPLNLKKFALQAALDVINSLKFLSGAGSDGLRLLRLQSATKTCYGRHAFRCATEVFRAWALDYPHQFPPELWQLFAHVNCTTLREKGRHVCVGMTLTCVCFYNC